MNRLNEPKFFDVRIYSRYKRVPVFVEYNSFLVLSWLNSLRFFLTLNYEKKKIKE